MELAKQEIGLQNDVCSVPAVAEPCKNNVKKEHPDSLVFCEFDSVTEPNLKLVFNKSGKKDPLYIHTDDENHGVQKLGNSETSESIKTEIQEESWDVPFVEEEIQDMLVVKIEPETEPGFPSTEQRESLLLLEDDIKLNVISQENKKEDFTNNLGTGDLNCKTCNKSFATRFSLHRHQKLHTKKNAFECEVCNKIFNAKIKFTKHKLIHLKNRKKEADTNSDCAQTVSSQQKSKKRRYTCEVCNRTFSSKSYLLGHQLTHKGQLAFKCNICCKAFSLKKTLREHEKIHSDKKQFNCDLCGQDFIWKTQYMHHLMKHTGLQLHKCEMCNKTFRDKPTFLQHQRVHANEKRFKCDLCDKEFNWKQGLLNHQLTHRGERLYKCDFCDKSFIRKGDVVYHLRTHIRSEGFKCEICDKSFATKFRLSRHGLVHSKVKPFICEICNRGFNYKAKLQNIGICTLERNRFYVKFVVKAS